MTLKEALKKGWEEIHPLVFAGTPTSIATSNSKKNVSIKRSHLLL